LEALTALAALVFDTVFGNSESARAKVARVMAISAGRVRFDLLLLLMLIWSSLKRRTLQNPWVAESGKRERVAHCPDGYSFSGKPLRQFLQRIVACVCFQ
jgi:hypothetical protein